MKYENIPINESTGRLVKCLKCENEDIDESANYCHICGCEVFNICSNEQCKTPCTGNARFCVNCGSETSFLKNNVLKPWSDIKKHQNSTISSKSYSKLEDASEYKAKKDISKKREMSSPTKNTSVSFKEEKKEKTVTYPQVTSLDDDDEIPFSRLKI